MKNDYCEAGVIFSRLRLHTGAGVPAGDVPRTYAVTARLEEIVGYKPAMEIEEGIERFVCWYREWRGVLLTHRGLELTRLSPMRTEMVLMFVVSLWLPLL